MAFLGKFYCNCYFGLFTLLINLESVENVREICVKAVIIFRHSFGRSEGEAKCSDDDNQMVTIVGSTDIFLFWIVERRIA
jgi:hypothetical protein